MSSSWFPFNFSFQNLTPPLSIQRRFISFILKRSLGHLLKSGQLSIDQIDAQIGSGFVEVKDLELDNTAINALVEDLPVQLQSGTIATVTARIPWPNPFSSTVGLSLSGMHLIFSLAIPSNASRHKHLSNELAESVASVAETFIHEELTEKEEALLRDSVHSGRPSGRTRDDRVSSGPPGCLEPFLGRGSEQVGSGDNDPEGVSVFAGLFESLLARFDFDASDTKITLLHSDNAAFTVNVARIRYLTESSVTEEGSGSNQAGVPVGETRSVQIQGMELTMRDISPASFAPSSPPSPAAWTPTRSTAYSTYESSDSELDDETQMMMSQSLVSLPPRPVQSSAGPPSPSLSTISSVSAVSSVYQSAISASGLPSQSGNSLEDSDPPIPVVEERNEQLVLAVSEPIIIRLTTPPPYVPPEPSGDYNQPSSKDSKSVDQERSREKMKVVVSLGIVAISLHARNIRGILSIVNTLSSAYSSTLATPGRKKAQTSSHETELSILDRLELTLHMKGIVALIHVHSKDEITRKDDSPEHFFSKPLVPPYMPSGYVRLHVDSVEAVLAGRTPSIRSSPLTSSRFSALPSSSSSISSDAFASCTISDISVLAFHASVLPLNTTSTVTNHNTSSPILITDLNLASSYQMNQPSSVYREMHAHTHSHPYSDEDKRTPLPVFDVVDWTSENGRGHGTSLRAWRMKPSHPPYHRKVSSGLGAGFVSNIGLSTSPTPSVGRPLATNTPVLKPARYSAISAMVYMGEPVAQGLEVIIKTAPWHVFLDLEAAACVVNFIDGVLPHANISSPTTEIPPPSSVLNCNTLEDQVDNFHSPQVSPQERERRRLEKLVLDDLELGMDYRQSGDVTPTKRANLPSRRNAKIRQSQSKPHIEVFVPLVRVEVRVPPPRNRQPRSGYLVLDSHSVRYTSNPPLHSHDGRHTPRFKEPGDEKMGFGEYYGDVNGSPEASFEMQRIVVAYAGLGQTQAVSLLSLGPINDSDTEGGDDLPPLLPLVLLRSFEPADSTSPQVKSTALLARVPSMHVVLNKALLDGLQLWADDIGQWAERANGSQESGNSTRTGVSRNTSLIGSRYFVQRSGSTESEGASTLNPGASKSEIVVKAALSEVFIRLVVPIGENTAPGNNRYLDVCASDLDALVEVKPEGKEETVVSMNILDAKVTEVSSAGSHSLVTSSLLTINRRKQAVMKLRFRTLSLPGTIAKESRVRLSLHGLRINLWSELEWLSDLSRFAKAPPGAFESVVPSERTQISVNILECAFRLTPPTQSSALVLSLGDVGFSTDLVGDSQETALNASVAALSVLLTDDSKTLSNNGNLQSETDKEYWMGLGYALLATIKDLRLHLKHRSNSTPPDMRVGINGMNLSVHLCADSISGIAAFATDLQTLFASETDDISTIQAKVPRRPTDVSELQTSNLLHSLDEQAFRQQPVIGPLPDMISDDLPSNPEYLDASFGAAAGFRPLDDDEEEFYPEETDTETIGNTVSRHGGETIKMLCSPINIVENFYDTLTPSSVDFASEHGDTSVKVRAQDCNVHLLLYDGYDWERTRRAIQEEVKRVKRRLAKIRQLLANGQTYDPNLDEVNTVLFNSIYVGLDQDAEELEREALIAAIDDELDDNTELASGSSWQSFRPNTAPKSDFHKTLLRTRRLNRSKGHSIEFSLRGMAVDFDQYLPGSNLASRLLFTIKDLEILDHIKTSTWSTFLTEMRKDSQGNIRESDSNMVRVELQMLLPYRGHLEQEARLKAKLLPLRLHVDQDALDFLKKFFGFRDSESTPSPPPENEIFFQHVEIFPVDIKLDYKPRRVDYRALKEGKTIELMNFFHFDGAEMTLRHITLKGITGWPRMFDTLNDLWTPDVKANQLVDVISGVSPIRSAVNVGSGVADLILLPIAQYKKDGRIIRGLQKGTTAFVKSTAMEAIRLGARLATGTQVVLEQTETVLGGQFTGPITAETLQVAPGSGDFADRFSDDEDANAGDLISKYAEQPTNIKEGVQSAYRTLSQNMKSAGQTILAVPMEVYERSGKEGPARAVIRAVPIAVLKPMIGASEAISKTLLGLHNTLDPQAQIDTEAKYKHR